MTYKGEGEQRPSLDISADRANVRMRFSAATTNRTIPVVVEYTSSGVDQILTIGPDACERVPFLHRRTKSGSDG